MARTINIGLMDNQSLFRKGLISLLKDVENIRVIIEADDGNDLSTQMNHKVPDLILLDFEKPLTDGFKTIEWLRTTYPSVKIILLSMITDDEMILHLIEKGINGFLLKNIPLNDLLESIYLVKDKGYYYDDRITQIMLDKLTKKKKIKPSSLDIKLTNRELEVIRLIGKELKNSEIAEKLFINVRTVDRHRENIRSKINVKNTSGIIMFAVRNNLLE
jgi:DNA-binding NarL/FixJ family response regulator